MTDTDILPTAFSNSMDILQDVRQAESLLQAAFGPGCVDGHGLLARPDACSDALTSAIRALLQAQKRLAETPWPQPAYQPIERPEIAQAAE